MRRSHHWYLGAAVITACSCAALSVAAPGPVMASPASIPGSTGVTMTIDQRGAVTGMGSSSGVPLAPTSDATHMPFRVMVTYSHDGKVSSESLPRERGRWDSRYGRDHLQHHRPLGDGKR